MQQWWQESEEALVIQEIFQTEVDLNPSASYFQEELPMPSFAGAFEVGYWDEGNWDKMLWSTPGTEESGAYNLRITAWSKTKALSKTCDARISS